MKSICFNPLWLNHSFRPLNNYATIREINAKLDVIQGALKKEGYDVTRALNPTAPVEEPKKPSAPVKRSPTVRIVEPPRPERDDMVNPLWIEEKLLGQG